MVRRQDASTGQIVADEGEQAAQAITEVDGRPVMHIRVYSPYQIYFDDIGFSISGVNGTGPFDILPRHHNFITLLDACELSLQTTRGEQRIRISGGLMHVKTDNVVVFLDV
ncbi:MAG TPA: hypothetical protein VF261_02175 [Candidatus Saccharimonadales bacterium]